jgi:hypothetical protein
VSIFSGLANRNPNGLNLPVTVTDNPHLTIEKQKKRCYFRKFIVNMSLDSFAFQLMMLSLIFLGVMEYWSNG